MDLCSLIERNAAFAPDKPAIHFEGETLSYAAFNARIEQTAYALKSELGVGRGDRVAILSLNRPGEAEGRRAAPELIGVEWRHEPTYARPHLG